MVILQPFHELEGGSAGREVRQREGRLVEEAGQSVRLLTRSMIYITIVGGVKSWYY